MKDIVYYIILFNIFFRWLKVNFDFDLIVLRGIFSLLVIFCWVFFFKKYICIIFFCLGGSWVSFVCSLLMFCCFLISLFVLVGILDINVYFLGLIDGF